MWQQVERILRQAMREMADHTAAFLPGVLVSLVLFAVAALIAVVVRLVVVRGLRSVEFDRRAEQFGISGVSSWSSSGSLSMVIGRTLQWTILILGLLLSLTALNATIPSRLAIVIIEYVPHLFAAFMILVVGWLVSQLLARSTLIGAVNMQIRSARLVSLAVKWLVLLVTVAMALDHVGIGRSVLLLAFGILFGGVVLTASIAVGFGARDAVSRAIEREVSQQSLPEDKVNHV
jgi:Mechanosensitive ion channel, conserved TM helix